MSEEKKEDPSVLAWGTGTLPPTTGYVGTEVPVAEVKEPQPSSDWNVYLLGSPTDLSASVTFRPRKGSEPNAFHRLMQRLILGLRWVKEPMRKDQGGL